jgi:hypothetical protein
LATFGYALGWLLVVVERKKGNEGTKEKEKDEKIGG